MNNGPWKNKYRVALLLIFTLFVQIAGPIVEIYAANNEEILVQEQEVEIEEEIVVEDEVDNPEEDEEEIEDKKTDEDEEVVEEIKEDETKDKEEVKTKKDVKTEKEDKVKPFAEEGKDLGSSIFTDVNIKINDKDLEEGTTEIEITDDLQLQFTFDWKLSNDVNLNAGDWAKIKLPDALKGVAGRTTGSLLESDVEVGTYEITEDGYLRVQFNDELTERSDRSGEVGFLLEFDLEEFEEDVNQSIKFEDPINKEFIIKAKPGGEVHDIKKSGEANENINPEYLNWTIDVNTKLESLTNATVEDIIPEGLDLDFDSIEVYELTVGYKGEITEGNIINGLGISEIDSGFKVDLGETDKAYRIKYKTNITEFDTEFTNDAVLKDEGEEKAKDKFTITGLERGSLIEKDGWKNHENKDQIIWQIDVNKSESSLENVKVLDEIPEGLNINSIRVWKLNKSGNDWSYGEELEGSFEGFPVDLGGIDGAYRIQVITDIDYGYFEEYTKELVFGNEAVLKVNGEVEDQDDAIVTVERESLLEKNGWESTNYGDSKISWKIHVNKAKHNIKDAVIKDTIGQGLELIKDTIKVFDSNNQPVDIEGKLEITTDGFTINLGDIKSEYRIEYDTKITENLPEGQEGYKNTVALDGGGLDGVVEEDTTEESTAKLDKSNEYKKENEYWKEIEDDITYDGLNYKEKTMSWKLTVDAIKEEITELTIKDSFEPTKSMKFIEDSLRVLKDREIVSNDQYALTDKGVDGFELTFKDSLDRAKYEIYFKTSFDPNEVLDAEVELNTGSEYKNTVTYTVTTKDVEGNEKEFTEEDNAEYNVKEEYVNSGKKSGSLDREDRTINWKIFANATGQDLTGAPFVITDTLTEGDQTLNEDVKVYEFSLDKDGNFIKGDEITEGFEAVVYNEEKDGFTLTFADGVDKPVLVEFSSKINGLSEEWYKNAAKVTDKNEQEKTYDAEVKYDRHNEFINKEATNVDGNITYTDDEIDWKISLNESLSDIKNAVFKDTISEGLVLVKDSIKVYKDAIAEDNIVDVAEDAITITPNDDGDTELSINLGDIKESRYFITYQTVVVATDGKISNEASLTGGEKELGNSGKKEYDARQSSWGTGSGKDNRGQIEIVKVDSETKEPIASPAKFELYYMLNGKKQVVTGEVQETKEGKIQYGNLPFRTYYLKEIEAPEGYVGSDEVIEIEVNKDNKEITIEIENIKESELVGKIRITKSNQEIAMPLYLQRNYKAPKMLAGAEFEIKDSNGNVVDTLITDEKGSAESIELPFGEYTVIETKAPEGYKLDPKEYKAIIGENSLYPDVYLYIINDPVDPEIEKDVNGKNHEDLEKRDEEFTYNVKVSIPEDTKDLESISIFDTLEDVLEVKDTKVLVGEEVNDELSGLVKVDGQKVELEITEGFEKLAGKELTLVIESKIKEGADLSEYEDNTVPNTASLILNNDPETKKETKPVTVKVKTYAVGDYTWIDSNGDGIQDENEPVLPGVKVELYDEDGETLLDTTYTNDEGLYIFDELEAGNYKVKFTLTEEQAKIYKFTKQNSGEDTKVDSDANPETGWTEVIKLDDENKYLTPNEEYEFGEVKATEGIDPTWDAGVVLKSTPMEPAKTKVDVEKVWVGKAQESVTINLLADGKKVDSVELSEENNWKHTFTDLPTVYDITDEKAIEYTVEEVEIEGYTVSITGNAKDGFVVTNTAIEDPEKPEDPKPEDPKPEDPKPEDPKPEDPKPEDPDKPELPKTGTNTNMTIALYVLGLISLTVGFVLRRKRN